MPPQPRQQRLTVFLIKGGLDLAAVIRGRDGLESHLVGDLGSQDDNLFVKASTSLDSSVTRA